MRAKRATFSVLHFPLFVLQKLFQTFLKIVKKCYFSFQVTLIGDNIEPDFGIGSVIAIPIEEWSLDLVTPSTECIRKNGECIKSEFPNPPEDSKVIPFSEINSDVKPSGIYVDGLTPIVDITGNVPKPGLYVLVAQYYQQYKPCKKRSQRAIWQFSKSQKEVLANQFSYCYSSF